MEIFCIRQKVFDTPKNQQLKSITSSDRIISNTYRAGRSIQGEPHSTPIGTLSVKEVIPSIVSLSREPPNWS